MTGEWLPAIARGRQTRYTLADGVVGDELSLVTAQRCAVRRSRASAELPSESNVRPDRADRRPSTALAERPGSLCVPREGRPLPCHGSFARYADDPHWRTPTLFYEYFDGDTGRGLRVSHQTSWTALIACPLEDCARRSGARAESRAGTAEEGSRETV